MFMRNLLLKLRQSLGAITVFPHKLYVFAVRGLFDAVAPE